MPAIAKHNQTDELHDVEVAKPREKYTCPHDCDGGAAYVRSHTRQKNGDIERVNAHFRYYECEHGIQTEKQSASGTSDTGGSGGESPLHKRRKVQAKNALRRRFNVAHHTEEYYIGDKRCDAVVILEDPIETPDGFGKGFVVEYQHKNEQKDIESTERHYARHNFTTLWLWEENFTFEGAVPDVDLFGGRVFKPWPQTVPSCDEWTGTPANRYRLQCMIDNGSSTRVDATLKKSFTLPTEGEYWSSEPWYSRFRYDMSPFGIPIPGTGITSDRYEDDVRDEIIQHSISGSDALLPPKCVDTIFYNRIDWDTIEPTTNSAKRYRIRAAIGSGTNTRVEATFKQSFILPSEQQYWADTTWRKRFTMRMHDFSDNTPPIADVYEAEAQSMMEMSGTRATLPPECSRQLLDKFYVDAYTIDTADELKTRAVRNGWQQSVDRSPLQNLRSALISVEDYIYTRSVVCSFAAIYIRGLGGGATTQSALDRMLNEDDDMYSDSVSLHNTPPNTT
jgi:hypothetical protein